MNIKEMLDNYMDEITYESVSIDDLTSDKLMALEAKNGFVIKNKNGLTFYINHKIEPIKFLNQIVIMEKIEEFTIVDVFGALPYDDNAENVVEYAKGLFGED